VAGNYGPLEIVSVGGKPILAVSRVYSLQRTAGYFERCLDETEIVAVN
jgi:hypothetical protein